MMKLYSIESNDVRLDGGCMFGNAPKALWSKWLPADEVNRIHLSCRTLLTIQESGQVILFEAGAGPFFEPKLMERYGIEKRHKLIENLKAIGITEKDVDAVVLSHLHFDHAGGLLSAYDDGPLQLVFPKAKFYIGKKHWTYAQKPHIREKASFIPQLHSLLENSSRLKLIEGDKHPDIPRCSFEESNGHTIGLLLAEIESPHGMIVYASDAIPGVPWLHIPITMGYDRYPALIVDEKMIILERLAKQNGILYFTHDPATPCVQISKDNTGKYVGKPYHLV